MKRFDRFLNNRATRRTVLSGLLVLLLTVSAAVPLGGLLARYCMQFEVKRMIEALGERAAASIGMTPAIDVRVLPEYAVIRRYCVLGCAVPAAVCTVLVTLLCYLHTDRVYRDLDELYRDCMQLAEDFTYKPALRGSESGSVRRICDGLSRVAHQADWLSQRLAKRQNIHKALLSDVSHQLKTSLAVIRLNRDMLSSLPLSPEDRQRLADEITLHLDGMEQLVLEALQFAKLNADAVQYDRTGTELAATCQLAADRLAAYSQERGVIVKVEADDGITYPHDRVWLCEAVENLIKNAVDHADCTAVTVSLTVMPSAVRFSVRDNGKGIPQDEIPHIFDRFHSGAADAVPHSTGLGMAISRQIFRAHGCELTVYSDSRGTEILSFFRQR